MDRTPPRRGTAATTWVLSPARRDRDRVTLALHELGTHPTLATPPPHDGLPQLLRTLRAVAVDFLAWAPTAPPHVLALGPRPPLSAAERIRSAASSEREAA